MIINKYYGEKNYIRKKKSWGVVKKVVGVILDGIFRKGQTEEGFYEKKI